MLIKLNLWNWIKLILKQKHAKTIYIKTSIGRKFSQNHLSRNPLSLKKITGKLVEPPHRQNTHTHSHTHTHTHTQTHPHTKKIHPLVKWNNMRPISWYKIGCGNQLRQKKKKTKQRGEAELCTSAIQNKAPKIKIMCLKRKSKHPNAFVWRNRRLKKLKKKNIFCNSYRSHSPSKQKKDLGSTPSIFSENH